MAKYSSGTGSAKKDHRYTHESLNRDSEKEYKSKSTEKTGYSFSDFQELYAKKKDVAVKSKP